MSVAHHAPSPIGSVRCSSTPATGPTSRPRAHSRSVREPSSVDAGARTHIAINGPRACHPSSSAVAPGPAGTAPRHFVPGHLVLAHLARTRSHVFGRSWRAPVPAFTITSSAPGAAQGPVTGVLSMPSFPAHHLLGTPSSSPAPANPTRAFVAWQRSHPHAGAPAASTRTANPACSGLAQLRCARH